MNPYLLINIEQVYRRSAPIESKSITKLLSTLSHKSKVICALEAAKMAFFRIWDGYRNGLSNLLDSNQMEAPKKAIDIIEEWIGGNVTRDWTKELRKAVEDVSRVSVTLDNIFDRASKAVASVSCVASAVYVVETGGDLDYAYSAIFGAMNSYTYGTYYGSYQEKAKIQFYNEWWARCVPLVEKEFQDKYDIFTNNINGAI